MSYSSNLTQFKPHSVTSSKQRENELNNNRLDISSHIDFNLMLNTIDSNSNNPYMLKPHNNFPSSSTLGSQDPAMKINECVDSNSQVPIKSNRSKNGLADNIESQNKIIFPTNHNYSLEPLPENSSHYIACPNILDIGIHTRLFNEDNINISELMNYKNGKLSSGMIVSQSDKQNNRHFLNQFDPQIYDQQLPIISNSQYNNVYYNNNFKTSLTTPLGINTNLHSLDTYNKQNIRKQKIDAELAKLAKLDQ
jgi:hypothetical protein